MVEVPLPPLSRNVSSEQASEGDEANNADSNTGRGTRQKRMLLMDRITGRGRRSTSTPVKGAAVQGRARGGGGGMAGIVETQDD